MDARQRLLATAIAEVGYLEKKTNKNLDSKMANAGYNNYTKYARDLDAISGFYNGKKQGYAWCDMFVDWCFVTTFGVDNAKLLLGQPNKSYGAGCGYSRKYFKAMGRLHTKNPEPGDQIFFWNSAKTKVAHTGLVYEVDGTYVYTIEGNTSSTSGVIANGGGVFRKKYKLSYARICGYGRPDYASMDDTTPEDTNKHAVLTYGDKGEEVEYMQTRLKIHGHKLDVDGKFGPATLKELEAFQKDHNLEADGVCGPKTWEELEKDPVEETRPVLRRGDKGEDVKYMQERLIKFGYDLSPDGADGKFGPNTEKQLKAFQKKNNLVVDGVCGPATWEALERNVQGYWIQVTASSLNVRKGPSTKYAIVDKLKKGAKKYIIEEEKGWGHLSDINGWISLQYTKKI